MRNLIKNLKLIILQVIITLGVLAVSWLILKSPVTQPYYLQFFCFYIAAFFLLNFHSRHHRQAPVTPEPDKYPLKQTVEVSLVGGAIFLLVGSTGGLGSMLLSFYYIYFFFAIFVNPNFVTGVRTITELVFLFAFTPDFNETHYATLGSFAVFIGISYFAHKYYQRALKDSLELQNEKEKVAYYNMYAEKKQSELIAHEKQSKKGFASVADYVSELIIQVDELQKESRFSQNQLIVSQGLTRVGLSLRRVLHLASSKNEPESTSP